MNHKIIDKQNQWKEHVEQMDRGRLPKNDLNTNQEDIATTEDPYAVGSINRAAAGL